MKRLFVIFALTIVTMSASAQLLYKISGKGLSSPSYIVGIPIIWLLPRSLTLFPVCGRPWPIVSRPTVSW